MYPRDFGRWVAEEHLALFDACFQTNVQDHRVLGVICMLRVLYVATVALGFSGFRTSSP